MILLDTNVLSELMRPRPHESVLAWLARQRRSDLYATSINKAEILYGIALLPEGRRKAALAADAERMFSEDLKFRVLAFDEAAAVHYASLRCARSRMGKPFPPLDAQIAAIALAAGAGIATRNITDFEGCGLPTVNPWSAV